MELKSLVKPSSVITGIKAKTKKQLLQDLAEVAGRISAVPQHIIFEALLQRERLGSTGVGRGIAIPHCRIAEANELVVIFARLETAIAFDAADSEPVDLVFLLVAPEHAGADHLKALACISRAMRDAHMVKKLRAARDKSAVFAILTESAASHRQLISFSFRLSH